MAKQLLGKEVTAALNAKLQAQVAELKEKGITPKLGILRVGANPSDLSYEKGAVARAELIGVDVEKFLLPEDVSKEELIAKIEELNADPIVDGILVQLPLPKHIDELKVLDAIAPEKDADGFHVISAGKLFTGREAPLPCTPAGCMELLRRAEVPMKGANAVVVGRSNIVGKPMAILLLNENCTVTVCHSRTKDLAAVTREADILVLAVGRAKMITGDMVKPGAAVIDVGINRNEDGTICGDADYESVEKVAGWITPVPGGVGPMTIAMLMKNSIEAAERRAAK